jgi:hypothetical protein
MQLVGPSSSDMHTAGHRTIKTTTPAIDGPRMRTLAPECRSSWQRGGRRARVDSDSR